MATITGSEVLAQSLRSQGVDTMFYLMGGPMLETEAAVHQARHPRHRYAPRAGGGAGRACVDAGDAPARRGHGLLGPRRHQSGHRRGQRLHRLRAARRHRRLEPARLPRHGGLPGDRPGRADRSPITKWTERIYDARRIPDVVGHRVPPGDHRAARARATSTCRATSWARRWRRSSSTIRARGGRRRARLGDPGAVKGGHRAPREGRAPGRDRGQRRLVVGRRRRAPGLRGGDRHPLLHHADLARRSSRRITRWPSSTRGARPSPRPTWCWRWARASTG